MKNAIYGAIGAVLLTGAVWGQEEASEPGGVQAQQVPAASAQTNQITSFNKASTFLGSAIQSTDGKPIGKVQDLVFDAAKGQIGYAVIALQNGDGKSRSVAVPVTALKAAQSHLVLNMSEHVLAASEGITEGEWPSLDAFAVGGPAGAESGSGSSSSEAKTPSAAVPAGKSQP